MGIKVLYAGDSPVGGAANYLLGILGSMKADVTHLPPSEKLKPSFLKKKYDVIILSDYSKKQLPDVSARLIAKQHNEGAGLLMIGGWGSYSGPFGGWRGSSIEKLLPVTCQAGDDRTNFPGGATVSLKSNGGFLNPKWFKYAPAICGMNRIFPKSNARVLLRAKRILSDGKRLRFESKEYPLLVIGKNSQKRSAALATDLAPHWCGGLVDWGNQTRRLQVTPQIQVQIGNYYTAFVSSLLRWLAQK